MEATFPDPDDTITITSAIHKSSSVSFKLNNYTKVPADFTAGFTSDSDFEFSVTPKAGILESARSEIPRLMCVNLNTFYRDSETTTFIVTFAPLEYGKTKTGKLIIQTDEMLWYHKVHLWLNINLQP